MGSWIPISLNSRIYIGVEKRGRQYGISKRNATYDSGKKRGGQSGYLR